MKDQQLAADILVVDDTIENLELLVSTLQKQGYHVRAATGGKSALRAARSVAPDLILLDVKMPEIDGYEVCRELKAQPETADIPIIFLSMATDVEDKVRAFQAGGVDYITKPIQPEELLVRVENHLRLHGMEKALRNSERQLRLIADNTPACISYVGIDDLRYRFVNRRHEETAGMSQDEMVGKHIREVIGESNYEFALKYIEEVKTGKSVSYVNEFDLAEGKRWIQVNYVPDIDESGKVRAVVVSSYDITDMKRTEEALRQSEEKYRVLAENAEDVIFTLDMNLNYTYVSPSVKTLRGFEPTEVIGHSVAETLPPESLAAAQQTLASELQGDREHGPRPRRSFTLELQMMRKDGSTVWTEVKVAFLRDVDGNPTGILGVTRDISVRKQMEEALRKSEHQMRLIADNSPAYIAYVGIEDLRYQFVNQKFESGFGIPREEMIGKHIREVIGESNYQVALEYIDQVKAGVSTSYLNFFDLQHGKRWVEVNYVPDFDEHGRVKGIVVFSYDLTETKSAEERLKESERRLSEIIDFLPDPTFAIDASGKVIIWNKAIEQMTGIAAEEMLGKGDYEYSVPFYGERRPLLADLVLQRDKDVERRYLEIRVRGEGALVAEAYHPLLRTDGAFIWATATPLYDGEGNVVGAIESLKDLTDRKRMEDELKESQELFSLFMDMLPHGVFIKEHDSTCIYVNQYVKDLFHGELWIGKNAYDVFPDPQIAEAMHEDDRKALVEGQTTAEEAMSDNTGVEHVFQTTKFRIPRAKKSPLIGGIGLDITDRVKAREDLRRSEEKYRTLYRRAKETEELYNSLLESTLDAIVTYDMEGRVTYVNNAFTETFGWVKEELASGVPYTPDTEKEITMRNVMQVTREGVPLKDFETKRLKKDGSLVDVGISASRFNDHEGNPAGMVVILRDITERMQAENELAQALEEAKKLRDEAQEASRAKSEFVANMSHEIRTPMNAIMGMTDLALRSDISLKVRDYLTKIRTSSQSLLRIINDVLDFSKIEAGRLDIEHVRFDLRDVLRNMSAVVCASEACADIEFLMAIGGDVPYGLVGDPLRLEQILTNLATNAVKFTPEGEVLVRVENKDESGDRVRLLFSVRDTGIGIPDEKIKTLFKPFTQADGSTTRQFGGSGLGLTICRRLVHMMGGEFRIESEPGKGSLFSFQLEFDALPDEHEQPLHELEDMRGTRVLVVDDNKTSQEILLDILKSFSFKATAVGSGEEALEELVAAQRERAYELALLDWKMPGIDGIETARRIDAEDRLSGQIPKIIMITAFDNEDVRRQAEEAGVEAFLTKPAQASLLLDTIMDVFGKAGPRVFKTARARARGAIGADRIRGARILIVEDNEINQQIAREILEYEAARVHIAWNGKEAVEAVNESEFDAVLMDIQMPEMDGYEATRVIRADDRFKDLPIIAMTAHAMTGDRERCLEQGMNDHIPKPISAADLIGALARWIAPSVGESKGVQRPLVKEPPEAGCELPDSLPGINVVGALRRLEGNRSLVMRLLVGFGQRYAGEAKKIREAWNSGDRDAVRRISHAMKGGAASIGAEHLSQLAASLEKRVEDCSEEEFLALAGELEAELKAVTDSCGVVMKLGESTADQTDLESRGSSQPLDLTTIKPLVRELDDLLDQRNSRSRRIVKDLVGSLEATIHQETAAVLRKQVSALDFENARGTLRRLAEKLGVRL